MRGGSRKSFFVVALLLAGCGGGSSAGGDRPVTLALDFQPNAVHAGVFATVREGLDRDRDLELDVRAPSASTDSLKLLLSGRADASIVDIHDLGLARERGEDVVGVGAIVQRPLAAVVVEPGVARARDLEGKRVGVTGLPSDDAVLRAVVESDGGDFSKVRRTTIGFSAVPSLVARKVDAVVTFWNAEGVALRERGVRTREFRVDEFGAPRYPELVLVVTRETLRERGRARRRPGGGARRRHRGGAARPTCGGARDRGGVRRGRAAREGAARGGGSGAATAAEARPRPAAPLGALRRSLRHPAPRARRRACVQPCAQTLNRLLRRTRRPSFRRTETFARCRWLGPMWRSL